MKEGNVDNYGQLIDNLGKLKRNETQMSEEEKKRYKKPLAKLRTQILNDALEIMKAFIVGGCNILTEDKEDLAEFWKRVATTYDVKAMHEAIVKMFETYDLVKALEEIAPMKAEIFYKAYGPYWIKHCKKTDSEDYPYHNDIIDMEWWNEKSQWAKTKMKNSLQVPDYFKGFTVMLPPTMELLEAAYENEMKRYA